MKNRALLVCLLAVALVLPASAQVMLVFSDLTPSNVPIVVPNGYSNLNWHYVYSVAPLLWTSGGGPTVPCATGAGPGFTNGPDAVVGFVGGNCVCVQEPMACQSSINGTSTMPQFQVISASVSAGWQASKVTFIAYLGGVPVGSVDYDLTVTNQLITFPTQWGYIDHLKIWPHVSNGQFGSVVFYAITINPIQLPG